jgi:hypothetical protein
MLEQYSHVERFKKFLVTTVEGFSASTMVIPLFYRLITTTVPTVAATATDANADVTILTRSIIPDYHR